MQDRLELLKGFLIKASDEEDDDFDISIFEQPKVTSEPLVPSKPIEPSKPTPVVTVPAKPDVPSQTKLEIPSWFSSGWAPKPKAQAPTTEAISQSSWFDPTRKQIKKVKLTNPFPTLDWLNPESLSTKPVERVPAPIPEPKITSLVDAKKVLNTLPTEEHLESAILALESAEDEIRNNPRKKSLIIAALTMALAHFQELNNHADMVFGNNKVQGLAASEFVINYLNSEIAKLPKNIQEAAGKKLQTAIQGRKPSQLRALKSQWYGPEMLFINSRALQLMKAPGITADDAEETAGQEWKTINELVEQNAINQTKENKDKIKDLGLKYILDGASLEDAQNHILNIIKRGVGTNLEELFKDEGEIDFEEDLAESDVVQNMTDESIILENLENLPKKEIQILVPKIMEFGNLVDTFIKVREQLRLNKNNQEAVLEFQEVYDQIISLSNQILLTNPEYINTNTLSKEQFFDIYATTKRVEADADELGVESLNSPISAAESVGEGLGIDVEAPQQQNKETEVVIILNDDAQESTAKNIVNLLLSKGFVSTKSIQNNKFIININGNITQSDIEEFRKLPEVEDVSVKSWRNRRPNESFTDYGQRKIHEKALADRARERYLARILESGDVIGYLARKREYQRARENPTIVEMDRIRKPEYKSNNREEVKWKYLASVHSDNIKFDKLKTEINKLILAQEDRTNKLFQKVSESWLKQNVLDEIVEELFKLRISQYTKAYNEIQEYKYSNPFVVLEMHKMINNIPKYFEDAKDFSHGSKTSHAQIIWNMASVFYKNTKSFI